MELFATSKNQRHMWSEWNHYILLYLGPSLDEAIEAVGAFVIHELEAREYPEFNPRLEFRLSALPKTLPREDVRYYAADGWWYHIEKIMF